MRPRAPDRGAHSSRYTKVCGVAQGVVISSVRCFAAIAWRSRWPPSSACRPAPNFAPSNADRRAPRSCSPAAAPRESPTSACFACWTAWASAPTWSSGTSMGAVVGALYASGYSGRELDSLARVVPLAALFRTYQPLAPRSLGMLQPLVAVGAGRARLRPPERLGRRGGGQRPGERRHAPREPARPRGFRLPSHPVPRRRHRSRRIARRSCMRSGDLAQAVRASAAVPLLFAPERRDGRFLTDGGLSANIPVAVARAEGAERVIVVDATEHPPDSLDAYSPLLVADRLVQFLFQQPPDSLHRGDLLIRPGRRRLHQPQFLPREHRAAARRRGARAADSDPAPTRLSPVGARSPRHATLPTRLGRRDDRRRQRLGAARPAAPAGPRPGGRAIRSTTTCCSSGCARSAAARRPTSRSGSRPAERGTRSRFDLTLRRAARRVAGLGLAYDNELGGRMWAGVVDRRFLGLALEGSGALFLGELRRELYARIAPQLSGRPPALQSDASPCGWRTRTSGSSTATATSSAQAVHPRGHRLRRASSGRCANGMGTRGRRRRPDLGRARPSQPLDRSAPSLE